MTESWRLSATDLATRIRARDLSATDAAREALARLDAVKTLLRHARDERLHILQQIGRQVQRGGHFVDRDGRAFGFLSHTARAGPGDRGDHEL